MFTIVKVCRICKKDLPNYTLILDLGVQALTGVFPRPEETIEKVPITVIRCPHCGLVQLLETVEPSQMFGDTYGYASSLNKSMVDHLVVLADYCEQQCELSEGSVIVDVGSNDATFLKQFLKTSPDYNLLGMDPSAIKYKENYWGMKLVTDYFSKENYNKIFPDLKADLVTSIACYYDLSDPVKFAQEVSDILTNKGVWVIEAAYLPFIIERNCFDGCCHEHLNYYSLTDINNISKQVGLHINDVEFNDINGGSFRISLSKKELKEKRLIINNVLKEEATKFNNPNYFSDFTKKTISFKQEFVTLLTDLKNQGKMIYGLGASTKFNVLLQYCNVDTSLIFSILDVNDYKFYRTTPGTKIPIYDEITTLPLVPDNSAIVVGPYHFKNNLLKRQNIIKYMERGGKVVFPLPEITIYSNE